MFRFVHSSDLHLGKAYGQMPEDVRGNLTEARFQKIAALADLAVEHGATHVLLAGDTFDAETPSPRTRRQAMTVMSQQRGIHWVILPGNHDSLAATELWHTLAGECPDTLTLALEEKPVQLSEAVTLLPAPCPARRAGRDLCTWMDEAPSCDGHIRIGLAHGGVHAFSENDAADTLAPDRASRARLDYLALGDWHGCMEVEPRTWYSGTPEPDRFKHEGRAGALVVTVPAAGATPQVSAAEVGDYLWATPRANLVPGADPMPQILDLLPGPTDRRKVLVQLTLAGRADPAGRAALLAELEKIGHDFAHFRCSERDLAVEYEATDLDRIGQAGVLRTAADELFAQIEDADRTADDRAVARRALNRLYGLALEVS